MPHRRTTKKSSASFFLSFDAEPTIAEGPKSHDARVLFQQCRVLRPHFFDCVVCGWPGVVRVTLMGAVLTRAFLQGKCHVADEQQLLPAPMSPNHIAYFGFLHTGGVAFSARPAVQYVHQGTGGL